ncbi:sulfur oxidation c-type cytochrome SoxA [Candidatus Marithrix sp. Canyon 246]|uniref:sulfur oxidation c-type cytochrome SoxA n=1 Tax=Candidatus Marithrix sp. Canyon 246 TaxID=1827136 RepID=UPI00084A182C|nr:sulfur oxidation c-type cytochrome SoxA [Candidatus Marithrix sp. Canyon 246]
MQYNKSQLLLIYILIIPLSVKAAEMPSSVPLDIKNATTITSWKSSNTWSNYSNLRHTVKKPVSVIQPITSSIKANPANGKKLVANRKKGNCVACHILPDVSQPGNIGMNLSFIGAWNLPDQLLFNYIYDARIYNPNTVMPPWGAHNILTTDEIKDIVSYLKTLTIPVPLPQRRIPTNNVDNLDEFENPAMFELETGADLFIESCQKCHKNPEDKFAKWAVTMPKFEPRLNKIIGIEEFITRHAKATTNVKYLLQSEENLALTIYLRNLANGQKIAVDTSDTNTNLALKRGKTLTQRKIGQLNFACTDCHKKNSGKWIRGQYLKKLTNIIDHYPTYRSGKDAIWDINKRIQWCNLAARANDLPPDAAEYADIELYLTVESNGSELSVPGFGP